jgi:hypothetical protein
MKVIAIAAGILIAAAMTFAAFEPCAKRQLARATRAATHDLESGLPRFVAVVINKALVQVGVPGFTHHSCAPPPTLRRSDAATFQAHAAETRPANAPQQGMRACVGPRVRGALGPGTLVDLVPVGGVAKDGPATAAIRFA